MGSPGLDEDPDCEVPLPEPPCSEDPAPSDELPVAPGEAAPDVEGAASPGKVPVYDVTGTTAPFPPVEYDMTAPPCTFATTSGTDVASGKEPRPSAASTPVPAPAATDGEADEAPEPT